MPLKARCSLILEHRVVVDSVQCVDVEVPFSNYDMLHCHTARVPTLFQQ